MARVRRHTVSLAVAAVAALLLCVVALAGCGGSGGSSGGGGGGGATGDGGSTSGPDYAVPSSLALSAFHNDFAQTGNGCAIDTSALAEGYVGAAASSDSRLKFQVSHLVHIQVYVRDILRTDILDPAQTVQYAV